MRLGICLLGAVALMATSVQAARLTYVGGDGGSWLDAGVWQDESGAAVTWIDGSTAVVGDVSLTLPSEVRAEGLEWTTSTKRMLSGAGTLTLGAGGIVNGGVAELNIQNERLHLAVDQTWRTLTTSSLPLICLDGRHPVTMAEGVTLKVTGRTTLRWNAKANLPATTKIHVVAPAYISMSDGDTTFGNPTVILDGNGVGIALGSTYDVKELAAGRLASTLHLRNGADIEFIDRGHTTTIGVPKIVVDGTPADGDSSCIYGAAPKLTLSSMEIEVAEGCRLDYSVTCAEADGVSAAIVKTGSGTLALGSAQATFSGGVDVRAGTLEVAGTASAGTGPLAAAEGATVALPASGTLANALAGAGTFEKSTAGELTLVGAAGDFSGRVVVSAGTLRAKPAAVVGGKVAPMEGAAWVVPEDAAYETDVAPVVDATATGGVWAGAGTALTVQSLNAGAGAVALAAEKGGLLHILSLAGAGWTKTAPGEARIDSLAEYAGATLAVEQGVLRLASASAIPEGCVVETSGSGIVQFDTMEGYSAAKVGGTSSVAFADGGSTTVDTSASGGTPAKLAVVEGQTLHVTALTGAGDFYKTGDGTLELAGAENFAGRIIVQGGTLRVTGAVGENTVVVENGLFTVTGAGTVLRNSFEVQGGTLQAEGGASLGVGSLALAAAGTVCVTNGGTFGWSDLVVGAGTVRIAAGGVVTAASLKTTNSGTLVISGGSGIATPLITLDGGTLRFDADATLACPILQTQSAALFAEGGKTATLTGKYTNNGGKCRPAGPGQIVFAGGGEFATKCELFVQDGAAVIEKNDFVIHAFFGIEGWGRRLTVRNAKVLGDGDFGLHVGTQEGVESVFEVGQGGEVELQGGFHVTLGVGDGSIGRLRVTEGGSFKYAGNVYFCLSDRSRAIGSVEVVGGVFETATRLFRNSGDGEATLRFEDATVTALADLTLAGPGVVGELRGANTLEIGAHEVALGEVWSGMGSLAVTGADGTLRATASAPNWTGALTVTGADFVLGEGVELANGSVTVAGGVVDVAAGTAALPLLGGAAATKMGAGTLRLSGVDPAFNLTVEAGGVQMAPSGKQQPAGVPAVWLDAAAEASFTKSGTAISRWADRRGGSFYAQVGRNAPLYNATGFDGKPFVDFGVMTDPQLGRAGDNRMMFFSAQRDNIRAVFWMVGSRNGGGFLLGDSQENGGTRCFHRAPGAGTTYGAVASDPLWGEVNDRGGMVKGGTTWINGVEVDGTKTGLGGAWDLVSWRLSEADDAVNRTPCAVWLASCYNAADGRLNGGQDLAELLIYTNRLTDAEMRATQRYLADKWMPTNAANQASFGTLTMRGAGTSFTVTGGIHASAARVVVEGRGVTVRGVATEAAAADFALGEVSVATGGEWNAANFQGVTVTDLVLAENAVVGVTVDAEGNVDAVTVQGTLTLPSALLYSVTRPEQVAVRRTEILKAATLTGAPAWSRAEGSASGAAVAVDAAANALVLKGLSGTLIYVK